MAAPRVTLVTAAITLAGRPPHHDGEVATMSHSPLVVDRAESDGQVLLARRSAVST
jgi:hypothetical protein